MKNKKNPFLGEGSLREYFADTQRAADRFSSAPEPYWVTYAVGDPAELADADRYEAGSFGFLAVIANGPPQAEQMARTILAARTTQLGIPYTVTAVHSRLNLAHGLFALEAMRRGLLPIATTGCDLEDWEDEMFAAFARFIAAPVPPRPTP